MTERYVEIDATKRQQQDSRYGRDELNLAEFPLASLSDKVPKGQKTLEYSDTIWDQGRREEVARKVIVTASDKFGLPTAKDDEVLLALVQLTSRQKFVSPTVPFTRYQVLKELGWRDSSANYKRLELSLNRWLGVTLYYDRAWWSKEEQCWVNIKFHILSEVELLDRVMREERVRGAGGDKSRGFSYFTWNDRVFRNFQAGNLKQLDMKIIRALKRPTAKRMYRYLSKHFYRKSTIKMCLRRFACEHIGVPKSYHIGEIKRSLSTSIKELEEIGFLVPLLGAKRFTKEGGEWYVTFNRGKANTEKTPSVGNVQINSGVVRQLIDRGVSQQQAIQMANEYEEGIIRNQIEYLDYLVTSNDRKVSKNPAGYLYRAITESYAIPRTFESNADRARRKQVVERATRRNEQVREQREAREAIQSKHEQEWFADEWAKLKPEERAAIEERVEKKVKGFLGTTDCLAAKAFRENSLREELRVRQQQ